MQFRSPCMDFFSRITKVKVVTSGATSQKDWAYNRTLVINPKIFCKQKILAWRDLSPYSCIHYRKKVVSSWLVWLWVKRIAFKASSSSISTFHILLYARKPLGFLPEIQNKNKYTPVNRDISVTWRSTPDIWWPKNIETLFTQAIREKKCMHAEWNCM